MFLRFVRLNVSIVRCATWMVWVSVCVCACVFPVSYRFLNLLSVFAPTIFHVLCLTDTAIRRCPLVAVLGQGKGAQPGARRTLAAGCLRLVQAAVVAALQRSLLVRVLGLAHHREGHSAKRLQEKPDGRGSLQRGLFLPSFFFVRLERESWRRGRKFETPRKWEFRSSGF